MSLCKVCSDPLPEDRSEIITCITCRAELHDKDIGCSTVTTATWLEMSNYSKAKWRCVECRKNKVPVPSRGGRPAEDDDEVGSQDGNMDVDSNVPEEGYRSNKRRALSPVKTVSPATKSSNLSEDGQELLRQFSEIFNEKFTPIETRLVEVSDDVKQMKDNFMNQAEKIAGLEEKIRVLEDREEKWSKTKEELEKEVSDLKEKVNDVEYRVEQGENYSRKNNVVFRGIPVNDKEDPVDLAVQAAGVIGVNINYNDIVDCHRLPVRDKKKNNVPPFIVKFVNRETKRSVIRGYKRSRPTADKFGGKREDKVFADEHYAPATMRLLQQAKNLRNVGFEFVWCCNGVVCARKDGNSRVITIRDAVQLAGLLDPTKSA